MNAFWRDYWLMWRYAFLYQNPKPAARPGFYVALYFVLILLTLICLVSGKQSWPFKIAVATTFHLFLFCTYWLPRFVRAAADYNTSTCARLVPRIRRHAIRATILTWLLTTLTFVLLYDACAMLGELSLNPADLVVLCLIVGAILLFLLLWASQLFSELIFIPGFMISGLLVFLLWKCVSEFLTIWLAPWLQLTLLILLMLALMVVGHYCVNAVFRRGGERFWRSRGDMDGNASLDAGRQYNQSTGVGHQTQSGTTASAALPIPDFSADGSYAMALARDCAPGAPRTNLIMHVLGPSCVRGKITDAIHIFGKLPSRILVRSWLPVVAILLSHAFFLVGFVRPWLHGAKNGEFLILGWVLLSLLLFGQLTSPKRYVSFVEKTKAEQKLFRLSPGLPSFAALNRQLAMGLVRCALVDWFYWTCAIIALDLLIGTAYSYLLIRFCLCAMCMPFVSMLVLDYSRANIRLEFEGAAVSVFVLVPAFIMLYAWSSATPGYHGPAGWSWLVVSDLTNTLWAIGFLLCNAALTAVLVARRMALVAKAPVAFPAGRRTT